MKRFLIWVEALLLLAACKETPAPVLPMPEFTGFETEVTADAAVITVSHKGDYGIVEAGIYLGDDRRIKADRLESGRYSVSVSNLEASTTYAYKAFISSGLQELTSETQTFTTNPAPEVVVEDGGKVTIRLEDIPLKEILHTWNVDPANIVQLVLVGDVTSGDFYFIRANMSRLESVDLRGTGMKTLPNMALSSTNIVSVDLPDGLVEIGDEAFYSCYQLTAIRFPNGLRSIGNDAFRYCGQLTGSLVFPESLETIGQNAFEGTDFRGDLVIPRNIKSIPSHTFCNAGFDGRLDLPEGIAEVGESAFSDTHFQGELKLPDSILTIQDYAFNNAGFTGPLKLPTALKQLGDCAFQGNGFTGDLEIPDGILEIPVSAFSDAAVSQQYERVILHKDVQRLKVGAFAVSSGVLKEVICYAEEPPVNEGAFNDESIVACTLYVPAGSTQRYLEADDWKGFGSIKPIE